MELTTIALAIIALSIASFFLGRARSLALVGGPRKILHLHSLPGYYGYFSALWCLLPAMALVLLWIYVEPKVIVALVVNDLPDSQRSMSEGELNLLVNNIRNLAIGDMVSGQVDASLQLAAEQYQAYSSASRRLLASLALGLAVLGGAIVEDGAVLRFEIKRGGSGYSSPPQVTVSGYENLPVETELSFGRDFAWNGSVSSIIPKDR